MRSYCRLTSQWVKRFDKLLKIIILADVWVRDDSGGKPYQEVEGLGSSCYTHDLDFLIECEIKKFLHNMI